MPRFTVNAVPVPQPRQRSAMIGGHVRNYTPTTHPINSFKASVRLSFQQQVVGYPLLDEPMWLQCVFCLPRTAQLDRKKVHRRSHCGKRPDVDNLAKAVLDALNGLAWKDDSRIARLDLTKVYCNVDEQPHVEIQYGTFAKEF